VAGLLRHLEMPELGERPDFALLRQKHSLPQI